jgi:hypothetical protein
LTSTIDGVVYAFPPNTFAETAVVTHTIHFQNESPPTGQLRGVNRFFETAAVYRTSGHPAQPTSPYTVTVHYTDAAEGAGIESTLRLYAWNGTQWVPEPSSVVAPGANLVTARPSTFGLWAVLGETEQVYLPSIPRVGP